MLKQNILQVDRIDGQFGLKTEDATKFFQVQHGISVTGEFDAITRDAATTLGYSVARTFVNPRENEPKSFGGNSAAADKGQEFFEVPLVGATMTGKPEFITNRLIGRQCACILRGGFGARGISHRTSTFASFAVGMTVVSVVADGHARSLCDGAHMLLWPDVGRMQIERASSRAEWPISRTLNSANLAKLLRETGCRRFFGEGREDAFNTRR